MDDSLREMQWQHHSNIFLHNDTLCPMGSDCMEELGRAENRRGMCSFVDFDKFLGNMAPPPKKNSILYVSLTVTTVHKYYILHLSDMY